MVEINDRNIALLIDSENVSSKYVKFILNELNTYGTVSVRRIYGDWRANNDWSQELLLEYSIQPIQQFNYIKGKNSTDIALVIDAMDILYTNKVDIFCIVTSDSDFTRLAMRLRESHSYVIGMGESKVATALVRACNKFIYLDAIYSSEVRSAANQSVSKADAEIVQGVRDTLSLQEVKLEISNILSESDDEMLLGELGMMVHKRISDFNVSNYGYKKFSEFMTREFPQVKFKSEKRKNTQDQKPEYSEVVDEVYKFIEKNGGSVDNLTYIQDHLKSKYKNFNVKDYGFGKISTFLKSIPKLKVKKNTVKISKK